jgi:hypothetical protein
VQVRWPAIDDDRRASPVYPIRQAGSRSAGHLYHCHDNIAWRGVRSHQLLFPRSHRAHRPEQVATTNPAASGAAVRLLRHDAMIDESDVKRWSIAQPARVEIK